MRCPMAQYQLRMSHRTCYLSRTEKATRSQVSFYLSLAGQDPDSISVSEEEDSVIYLGAVKQCCRQGRTEH